MGEHLFPQLSQDNGRIVLKSVFEFLDIKEISKNRLVNGAWNAFIRDQILQEIDVPTSTDDQKLEEFVKRFTEITALNMSHCQQITNIGLQAISQHSTKLQRLDLNHCQNVTAMGLMFVLDNCRSMKTLCLSSWSHLTDEDLELLEDCLARLHRVELDGCHQITDRGAKRFIQHQKDLRILNLSHCPKISDSTLEAIGQCCRSLESLNLEGNTLVTDAGVEKIAGGCHALTDLNLSGIPNLSEKALLYLGSSLPKLRCLKLNGCQNVSDKLLIEIAKHCPHLKILHLDQCAAVGDKGLEATIRGCKGLVEIHLTGCPLITGHSLAVAILCKRRWRSFILNGNEQFDFELIFSVENSWTAKTLDLSDLFWMLPVDKEEGKIGSVLYGLEKGCAHLETFRLRYSVVEGRCLFNFLCDLSSLKTLDLTGSYVKMDRGTSLLFLGGYSENTSIETALSPNMDHYPKAQVCVPYEARLHTVKLTGDTGLLLYQKVAPQLTHYSGPSFSSQQTYTNCPNLQSLEFTSGKITEDFTTSESPLLTLLAEHCPQLHTLDLNGVSNLKDQYLSLPKQKLPLKCLRLQGPSSITAQTLGKVLHHYSDLEELDLGEQVTDDFLKTLPASQSKLRILRLNSSKITGTGLTILTQTWTDLETLHLKNAAQLTDQDLQALNALLHITELHLSGCKQLSGASFEHFSASLRSLDLSQCPVLNDAGLQQLGGAHQLEFLNLSGCPQITDDGLCSLLANELKTLELEGCVLITDKTLARLATQSPVLEQLTLSHCPLITEGGIKKLVEACPTLRRIGLEGCSGISGPFLMSLVKQVLLPSLKTLDLSKPLRPSEVDSSLFWLFPELTTLNIRGCRGVDDLHFWSFLHTLDMSACTDFSKFEKLKDLTSLKILRLSRCSQLTDEHLYSIPEDVETLDLSFCPNITGNGLRFKKLHSLNLTGCIRIDLSLFKYYKGASGELILSGCPQIDDRACEELSTSELHSLDLSGCKISDEGLKSLAKIKSLQVLKLANNDSLTDQGVRYLAGLEQLESLDLTKCTGVTEESLIQLVKECPKLQHLFLKGCSLTDSGVQKLTLGKAKLLSLRFTGIGDTGLRAVAAAFPKLEVLRVDNSNELTNRALQLLAKRCPKLHTLGLTSCDHVTDEGLSAIIEAKLPLQTLDLRDCARLSEEKIIELILSCKGWKEIVLDGVSDAILKALAAHRSLKCLQTSGGNISKQGLEGLVKGCPHLQTLHLRGLSKLVDSDLSPLSQAYQLEELDLSQCTALTGKEMTFFASLPLRILALEGCPLVDSGIHQMAQAKGLHTLNLGGCEKLKDHL